MTWNKLFSNPAGRYVVTVRGVPGERVLDEKWDEVGSPQEAAERVSMSVYATLAQPREIRVYDRDNKKASLFLFDGKELR